MDIQNPLDIVRHFAGLIQNGRRDWDIVEHAKKEIVEIEEELTLLDQGKDPGADGVVGEAIDVIACMLDLIFTSRPNITDAEINAILLAKCEKWARRYQHNVHGDRSID
jgi:hypothetical protein